MPKARQRHSTVAAAAISRVQWRFGTCRIFFGVADGVALERGGAALGGGFFTVSPVALLLSLILLTQAANLFWQSSSQFESQSPEFPYLFLQAL
jgi:hypothetical protein